MRHLLAVAAAAFLFAALAAAHLAWLGPRLAPPDLPGHAPYGIRVQELCRNPEVLAPLLGPRSVLLLGSSELDNPEVNRENPPEGSPSHPRRFFWDDHGFEVIPYGHAYYQSLRCAVTLAAMADRMETRKVALILGPVWFTEEFSPLGAYDTVFSELHFNEAMRSQKVPDGLKRELLDRSLALLSTARNKTACEEAWRWRAGGGLPAAGLRDAIHFGPERAKRNVEAHSLAAGLPAPPAPRMAALDAREGWASAAGPVDDPHGRWLAGQGLSDWARYDRLMLEDARASCAKGEGQHYICDRMWRRMEDEFRGKSGNAEDPFGSQAGIYRNEKYDSPTEYGDFELFLRLCQALGIEPLVINHPMNGSWLDYTGPPRPVRDAYYRRIDGICRQYPVYRLISYGGPGPEGQTGDGPEPAPRWPFRNNEYTPHFLSDSMHLAWRGFADVDREIAEYYHGR